MILFASHLYVDLFPKYNIILCFDYMQVQLLFSFLNEGKTLKLQETSLRCLHHMVTGGGCHLLDSRAAKSLFKIVAGPEFPVAFQCEALKILNQVILVKPFFY